MSQKLENLLNLALQTPEATRERTGDLNTGFRTSTRTWELIVKYHGSLSALPSFGITVEPLIAGYAILTVPENMVEELASLEQIEYVEKPKRYFFSALPAAGRLSATQSFTAISAAGELITTQQPVSMADVKVASCITSVTSREPFLTGSGVLISVLDSGIDYFREDFRNSDGTTRILFLWDQGLTPSPDSGLQPPEGFTQGTEFTAEQINEALSAPSRRDALRLVNSIDTTGHGTAVAGIAAGNAVSEGPYFYEGIAPQASLLIVKLGPADASGWPRTTEIMRGVTYAVRKALSLSMPLVINLSFGNSYGSHDGSSLLERFLDNAAEIGRTVICVGSGNEGSSAGHRAGNVSGRTIAELAVAPYEQTLSIQLWKNYADRFRISLRSPGGTQQFIPDTLFPTKLTLTMEQTLLLLYLGEPTPYSVDQELYIDMLPAGDGSYLNSGIWQLILEPIRTVTGQYYLYLPGSAVRSTSTGFYRPTPQVTLTIPSTASKVITVGAYDSDLDSYASFSGRGYSDAARTIGVVTAGLTKPDLAAPGVQILAPDRYNGYSPVTGTSFSTPVVSGSAALLMEWGIVRGNDPYLYGEKVKALLRGGARAVRGEEIYPNDKVGFGALCVENSLPI